jgi:signal transduction histidine kinase
MLQWIRSRFRPVSRDGERSNRVSILVPFLIISIGLGALAWRSYQLSVNMERGANLLAGEYARYAAEITARRLDAAANAELARVADEWQQIERRGDTGLSASLRAWLGENPWIVSALYVPDSTDPANSFFATELRGTKNDPSYLTREFFTSTGTLRYTYDPARLLTHVSATVKQQPLAKGAGGESAPRPADVNLIRSPAQPGLVRSGAGFVFAAPLQAPLEEFSVSASVTPGYQATTWQSQRAVSFLVSIGALLLTGIGGYFAFRGITKEAETMKLRSALIANVSHELRTPLSMIRLGAETLKRGSKLSPKDRAEIEDLILREVLHLSHMVENVLDVARMQHRASKALAFTPVSPRDLVTRLLTDYESWVRSKGFAITVSLDEAVQPQMWDREAVSRALLNLIDNAIKYSADEKSIDVILRQTDQHVVLEVKDRGIGIETSDVARIFDPYYRAQFSDTQTRRGAGLGLTLVRQIVESHGGAVEVDSQFGAGSTFRLLFPKATPEEQLALSGPMHSKPVPS